MRKVLLWGCGNDFRMIMKEAIWDENVEIIGVVESVKTKSQVIYQNRIFKIYAIGELDKLDFEKIIVANAAYKEILNTAQNNGIGFDKLIIPYHCNVKEFDAELVKKCGIYVKNAKSIIEMLDEQHGYARCILRGSG